MSRMSHHLLDVRRMLCPIPVIRTQNRIKDMAAGDTLGVLCSDPGALHDIPAWCRVHGHRVLAVAEEGDTIRITVSVCDN